MPLDSSFYERAVCDFENAMKLQFGEQMVQILKTCAYKDHGSFELIYKYLPLNYSIVIENRSRTFTITIKDEENASNSLYRIEKFDNLLEMGCIRKAVSLLKSTLEKNDFNLYVYKEDKVYRKNKDGLKRIKDLEEIGNG